MNPGETSILECNQHLLRLRFSGPLWYDVSKSKKVDLDVGGKTEMSDGSKWTLISKWK